MIAAESAGEPTTFCRPPEVTIAGKISIVWPDVPENVLFAVTTNCCKRVVACLVSGCTWNTLLIVNTVPLVRVAVLVVPLIVSVDPV